MCRLLLPVLLALGLGCGPRATPDVVLVVVDTLRADHLGLYGYERATSPELDRRLSGGRVYERAYSAAASTPEAMVSLLSGLLPQQHGVRRFYQLLPEDTELLPDLLPDAYQTAGFVSNMVLTDEALGLAARFDHYDDAVDRRESERGVYERPAERTVDAVLEWLDAGWDPERPTFLLVHLIDPHGPYRPPPDWTRRFTHEGSVPLEPERVVAYQHLEGVDDALAYVDAYDEEIAYADRQLGRLLDALDAHGLLDGLVVFTADHGETMIEHERWFSHGYHVYEGIAHVPLVLAGPAVPAGRVEGLVSSIDVVPTILERIGIDAPDAMRGRDLLAGPAPADRQVFVEANGGRMQWRAVLQGTHKWWVGVPFGTRQVRVRRHVDLARDPREETPGAWPQPPSEAGGALLALVDEDPDPGGVPRHYARGERLDAPKVDPRADAEALERLRALGYVDDD